MTSYLRVWCSLVSFCISRRQTVQMMKILTWVDPLKISRNPNKQAFNLAQCDVVIITYFQKAIEKFPLYQSLKMIYRSKTFTLGRFPGGALTKIIYGISIRENEKIHKVSNYFAYYPKVSSSLMERTQKYHRIVKRQK